MSVMNAPHSGLYGARGAHGRNSNHMEKLRYLSDSGSEKAAERTQRLRCEGAGVPQKSCVIRLGGPPMGALVFVCPNTGRPVPTSLPNEAFRDPETYHSVKCTVCADVHLVNPITGRILRLGEE